MRFEKLEKVDRFAFGLCVLVALYLAFQIARALVTPASSMPANPPYTAQTFAIEEPLSVRAATTTHQVTTTVAPRTTTSRATRSRTIPRPTTSISRSASAGGDFWHSLAECESENGRTSRNIFQFSSDTAQKMGIDGSESYEEQLEAAQRWARMIHPNEGTRSGWPNCWWTALAAQEKK